MMVSYTVVLGTFSPESPGRYDGDDGLVVLSVPGAPGMRSLLARLLGRRHVR